MKKNTKNTKTNEYIKVPVKEMGVTELDIEEIVKHYDHAKKKHPLFCYGMLPDWPKEKIETVVKNELGFARERREHGLQAGNLLWNEILNEEVWEISEALMQGDAEHAIYEAYDAIAVLLRVIDVLKGNQELAVRNEEQKEAVNV